MKRAELVADLKAIGWRSAGISATGRYEMFRIGKQLPLAVTLDEEINDRAAACLFHEAELRGQKRPRKKSAQRVLAANSPVTVSSAHGEEDKT